ncbi:hypothetical protein FACS1894137_15680 [Spirochaetia bacterium]|nr:hypothetical protein FACS1894137_15680 [Spirochaetia bacterium]
MGIQENYEAKHLHPIGQKIDALLIAEGFTRTGFEESEHGGFNGNISFRRSTYSRDGVNAFVIMNWPDEEKPLAETHE